MTEHQKDQILKIVSYYMEPELRDRIMREAPIAYNAWMGRPVVEVRLIEAIDDYIDQKYVVYTK
jgi:hypothetical protein